ncbi:MAG TPA: RidA family protein [Candidatus Polarisedimenticolia bacterium]|nr:RidA family protein [Candidatus Polarisedimenticolia bacterium]
MPGEVERNLESLGYRLPEVGKPLGSYVQSVRSGNLLFVSGKFPKENGRLKHLGKVGREITVEQGIEAARLAALSVLATTKQAIEELDRVKRVVRLVGYVAAAPSFLDAFEIMEGASEVFVKLYGDRGKHARLVLGVPELPLNACFQLEAILEVE